MVKINRVKIALVPLLVCALLGAAQAKTFKLGSDKPIVEMTIPDGWATEAADGGVEATATGAYLSAEIIDSDDLADATKSLDQFLIERKINLKSETKTQKAVTIAGLKAVENNWDATDADGPTRVSVTIFKLRDDQLLVLFYWRSASGETDHGSEVATILSSIKPVK